MGESKRRKKLDPNYGKAPKNGFASRSYKNSTNSQSDNYFKQGVQCESRQEYKKALDYYTKAIECDPSNGEAYFGRANIHDDMENYSDAIKDYTEHLRISGGSFRCFNNRGLVFQKIEDDENAISDFEQAIKFDPNQPSSYHQLGILVWDKGQQQRSIDLLSQAAKLYLKINNLRGYKICQDLIDIADTNLGIIKMAINSPNLTSIDWDELQDIKDSFKDDSSDELEEISPLDLDEESSNDKEVYNDYPEDREEYFKNLQFHLENGGAFEDGLPKNHKYKSVQESELFRFIQNAVDNEEQSSEYILSKVKKLSDLTEIPPDLLVLVDKSIMAKRDGNLNQAFKYYDQVFSQNQTWFTLWYGLAKLLCLFREYKMAFACIKICTYLYPKMWDGRQYSSDHNLSYHYSQIYAIAIDGEENEPYLKSLGRPLNTVRIINPSGRVKNNSPVMKLKFLDSDN